MITFKEFNDQDGVDYFILEISDKLLPEFKLINEGKWTDSQKKDWMQRIDAPDPSINLQRHVHIARAKHINTKTMQASWNEDGTKHDKKSFNSKIGSLNIVQSIARDALGLSKAIKLEEASIVEKSLIKINESLGTGIDPIVFKVTQEV